MSTNPVYDQFAAWLIANRFRRGRCHTGEQVTHELWQRDGTVFLVEFSHENGWVEVYAPLAPSNLISDTITQMNNIMVRDAIS